MHAKSIDSMVARHLVGSAPLLAQAVGNYVPDNAEIAQELLRYLVMAVESKGELPELKESSGGKSHLVFLLIF